jgi:ABC-2 type transport system ATP-binding protein
VDEIVIDNLTRRYGPRVGVEDLSLRVPAGTVFGFLGPNGAGKTTTIRVLLGFLRPTDGRARIFGRDCWRDTHVIKRDVGYMPGDLRLYPWMTGADGLRVFGRVRGRDLRRSGAELAEQFGLDLDVPAKAMSRGMRQKLGLILALVHEPKLLILDEPTASLDPLMQDRLNRHLRDLAAHGHTVFFSSHRLSEVEELCDRVAILRKGKLVADETLDSLRGRVHRDVVIRWPSGDAAAATEPPGCLDVDRREGRYWQGSLRGPVSELVSWLAGRQVTDLTVAPPDLESLFRRYYHEDSGKS